MRGLTKYNLSIVGQVFGGDSYNLELLELCRPSPLVVDLGANIGAFSLAALCLRADARIVAVEPDPTCHAALQTNLSAHQSAVTICGALSDRDGTVFLRRGVQDSVANSIMSSQMSAADDTVQVKAYGPHGLFDAITTAHGPISILKCDIEGGEWHLLDLPRGILEGADLILIEYHSAEFLRDFLGRMLHTHVIYCGKVRFPHRGELALLRRDLVPPAQDGYSIHPETCRAD